VHYFVIFPWILKLCHVSTVWSRYIVLHYYRSHSAVMLSFYDLARIPNFLAFHESSWTNALLFWIQTSETVWCIAPKQFEREYIWVFSENLGLLRLFSVCYEPQFCLFHCFVIGSKHRNKPKQTEIFGFGFTKQTETNPKQILFGLFRFEPNFFSLFRGHPTCKCWINSVGLR
jgi:hypothetical protein